MHITNTDFDTIEDIYDAVQTGEITRPDGTPPRIGDVINNKLIMFNAFHLEEFEPGVAYFLFTEYIKNHSTGHTYTDQYVAPAQTPLNSSFKHLETIEVTKEPININTNQP